MSIRAVNDVPIAVEDEISTVQDVPAVIDVLDNDTDVDSDSLILQFVTQGAHGGVTLNADNTLTYTPAPGFVGTDGFTYVSSDGIANSNPGLVIVVVDPSAPIDGGGRRGRRR